MRRPLVTLFMIVGLGALVGPTGCGSSRRGDSPAAVATSYVARLNARDPAITALFMTDADMDAMVTCDKPALREELATQRAAAEKLATENKATLVAGAWKEREHTTTKPGESRAGCTARRAIEMSAGTLAVRVTNPDGATADLSPMLLLVKTARGWRLWRVTVDQS